MNGKTNLLNIGTEGIGHCMLIGTFPSSFNRPPRIVIAQSQI